MHGDSIRLPTNLAVLCGTLLSAAACSDARRPTAPAVASPPATAAADQARLDVSAMILTLIDYPGANGTFPLGLNNNDEIVGRTNIAGVTHGFLRNANGDFTTIDYPGASFSVATAINNVGDIVGQYALPSAPAERHGFLLRDGEFTTFDPASSRFTNALGINERGDIVGRFCETPPCGPPGTGAYHGFLSREGTSTVFDIPDSRETNAWKINARGEILGGFRTADGVHHLFVLRGSELSTFDLPEGRPIALDNGGINERGDIVGVYCIAAPCSIGSAGSHGFLLSDGQLITIDVPGARTTGVFGITARGDMVGGYADATGKNRGFLLRRPD
jgi:hypothetical protein